MERKIRGKDDSRELIHDRTIAVIGYGNQGRAQALNARDSGCRVIVGNSPDAYAEAAGADGFEVFDIPGAVRQADLICLLLPDEIIADIFESDIRPHLEPGDALDFAHGYVIRYGLIHPPPEVDVIMVAPRMIGAGVRENYLSGQGVPAFVAVEQDAAGGAWPLTMAFAAAIGTTRKDALKTTFAEETELDLFTEQTFWPLITGFLIHAYDLLQQKGYRAEAILMELYASGETARVFRKMADTGLFRQMDLHSHTSQFGTMLRRPEMIGAELEQIIERNLEEIRDGRFARRWAEEKRNGLKNFTRWKQEALKHPINETEEKLKEIIKSST